MRAVSRARIARIARGDQLSPTKLIRAASPGSEPGTLVVWMRERGNDNVVALLDEQGAVLRVLLSTRNPECAQTLYEYERDRLRGERAR